MFRRFFQNLDIKIVSILIALLLWAHVVTDKEYGSSIPVLLVVNKPRPGVVLVESLPKEVPVLIRAKGRDLIRMHLKRYAPSVKLNLELLPVGKTLLDLSLDQIEVPLGITAKPLRFLISAPLNVVLDTLLEKRIRVRPFLEGDLADGFALGGPAIAQPEWVTLKGPKQVLLGLDAISTHPVNLEERDRPIEESISLDLSGLKLVRAFPETVTVTVAVEAMTEKIMERVPIRLVDSKRRPGTTLEPQTIRLVVQGRDQEMVRLHERSVSASIEVSNLPSGTYVLPARIELPKGFMLKSATPEHFKVVVK